MRSKVSNLFTQSFGFNYHVLVFTETWLINNILNSEILCSKYHIFRRDRDTKTIGGGVLIAVLSFLPAVEIKLDLINNIEFIAIVITSNGKKIFITCSYIPPNSEHIIYLHHFNAIKLVSSMLRPEDTMFALGDFNLPYLNWTFSPDSFCLFPININNFTDEFLSKLSDTCLFQINNIRNEFNRLLDLVFVNEPAECSLSRHFPITCPEDRHHPTLELNYNYECSARNNSKLKSNNNRLKQYCFKRADYDNLNCLLINTNWLELLSVPEESTSAIDEVVNTFYKTLKNYMDQSIPKQEITIASGPPWKSKSLTRLKNLKNKHYKKFKISGSSIEFINYHKYRAQYNQLNMQLYRNYMNNIKHNLKRDPKSFYKFVNIKRKSNVYPSNMKYSGFESSDIAIISNMFADFFATTYSDEKYDTSKNYPYHIAEQQPIMFPFIDTSSITFFIKKLKFSTSCGPDGIPNCLLINCVQSLTYPLSILFNISIKYGYFPNLWKDSFIIPLFKSGVKSLVNNYRGIAKLSAKII